MMMKHFIKSVILVLFSVIVLIDWNGVVCTVEKQKNILCLMSMASPSHHIWNRALMQALASQGHNVTALSIDTDPDPPANLHYIKIDGIYESIYGDDKAIDLLEFSKKSVIGVTLDTIEYFARICKSSLASDGFRTLMSYPNDFQFDLIIFDYTCLPCLLGFSRKFNDPPKIGVTAFALPPHTSDLTGTPNFPSLVPHYATYINTRGMNFWERSVNVVYFLVELLQRRYCIWAMDGEAKKAFGEDLPYIGDLEKDVELVLVNNHPSMDVPEPILPNVVQVGGLQITTPKEIPKDIKNFIESSKKGAVLFSLGTNMKSEIIGEEKIQMFLNTITKFSEYNFLWKIGIENMTLPKNLIVRKWLPQNDILAHPNIKLFLSHGGMLSSQEATWHGVPILGMPFFVDQYTNVQKSVEAGVGERLNFWTLTEDEIYDKLKRLLEDPSYQSAMSSRSRRFRDRPRPPLQEAVWWCEYVLRHCGAPHLRSAAATMTPVALYMWDMLIVWSLVVFGLFAALGCFIKRLFCKNTDLETDQDNGESKKQN